MGTGGPRGYSMFKVRRGSGEEIPLIQGKEQQLCFAGAAVNRYPTYKVRETQVRRWVLQEARPRSGIASPVAIRRGEGAQRKRTLGMGYLFRAAPAKRSHCSLPWSWWLRW